MNAPDVEQERAGTVVIDLGRHGRKKVKELRKGGGPLMSEVEAAVDELRRRGVVGAGVQVAVVVVERKVPTAVFPFLPPGR
jgi:hypothetical protein